MEYETIAGQAYAELEISRSRFLTRLERIDSEVAARAIIAEVRSEHPKARHHCTAFVLGARSETQRSNDDGEPSGTAGAPMLDALVSAGLSDVVAVVTRYFGGVLLGAGGLTRAYRAAVAEAVLQATRVTRAERISINVTLAYESAAQLEAEARRRRWGVGEAAYSDRVQQTFFVAGEQIQQVIETAAECSAGGATCEIGGAHFVDLK